MPRLRFGAALLFARRSTFVLLFAFARRVSFERAALAFLVAIVRLGGDGGRRLHRSTQKCCAAVGVRRLNQFDPVQRAPDTHPTTWLS